MRTLIISGTSVIGTEICKLLVKDHHQLTISGRNEKRLKELQSLNKDIKTFFLDVTKNPISTIEANISIEEFDFVLICAGTGEVNEDFNEEIDRTTVSVNVNGCQELLLYITKKFYNRGYGHIGVITSIASIMPSAEAASYNASKAFLSNYISGMQKLLKKKKSNVKITDILPGLVDTPMAKGEGLFWVIPAPIVAKQIYNKLQKKSKKIIVSKRWKFLYYLYKIFH